MTSYILSDNSEKKIEIKLKISFWTFSGILKKSVGKFKKFPESNKSGNSTYQNFWNTIKVLLRGKFIATNAYIKIKNISNI
jgi:hypothetical protein